MEGLLIASPSITIPALKRRKPEKCQVILKSSEELMLTGLYTPTSAIEL
jgi:hypothetical protein